MASCSNLSATRQVVLLLYFSNLAMSLSLRDLSFQAPILSFRPECNAAYNSAIPNCTKSDFQTACSDACIKGVMTAVDNISRQCDGLLLPSILRNLNDKVVVSTLCHNRVNASTVPQTSPKVSPVPPKSTAQSAAAAAASPPTTTKPSTSRSPAQLPSTQVSIVQASISNSAPLPPSPSAPIAPSATFTTILNPSPSTSVLVSASSSAGPTVTMQPQIGPPDASIQASVNPTADSAATPLVPIVPSSAPSSVPGPAPLGTNASLALILPNANPTPASAAQSASSGAFSAFPIAISSSSPMSLVTDSSSPSSSSTPTPSPSPSPPPKPNSPNSPPPPPAAAASAETPTGSSMAAKGPPSPADAQPAEFATRSNRGASIIAAIASTLAVFVAIAMITLYCLHRRRGLRTLIPHYSRHRPATTQFGYQRWPFETSPAEVNRVVFPTSRPENLTLRRDNNPIHPFRPTTRPSPLFYGRRATSMSAQDSDGVRISLTMSDISSESDPYHRGSRFRDNALPPYRPSAAFHPGEAMVSRMYAELPPIPGQARSPVQNKGSGRRGVISSSGSETSMSTARLFALLSDPRYGGEGREVARAV